MKAALILLLAASVNGRAANQEDDAEVTPSENLQEFDQEDNFRRITAEYVNSEYKNLSQKEKEEVNVNLDYFLETLAKDLTDVFSENYSKSDVKEEVRDGIDDAEFDSIKKTVVREFPEVDEEVASEIVFRLRKNLLATRHNLKRILSPET